MASQPERGRPYEVEVVELDGPLSPLPPQATGEERMTSPTGIRDQFNDAVGELATLLSHIAGEVGRELATIPAEHRPAEVEAEVCLGLSAQGGPVWLAVKGNYTLRAKLTWKKADAAGL
ncbi:hypothetical protein [Streptomyces sp. DSM 40484]|uniref:hypothetical protein n=1 Tax=Streptomyces kroppenstedtii TaxID=3051181 RepID=UPI0028CFE5DC|nr:hypothetical protein [Streptomyces sp. DSM 40484]